MALLWWLRVFVRSLWFVVVSVDINRLIGGGLGFCLPALTNRSPSLLLWASERTCMGGLSLQMGTGLRIAS